MTEGAATGGGPPLSMGLAGGPSLGRVRSWLARQAALQAGRTGLWVPVGLGCGAAIYFALPREPLATVGVAGTFSGRKRRAPPCDHCPANFRAPCMR